MSLVESFSAYRSPDREEHGLVIILPGIEGFSHLNRRIAHGLDQASIPYSIEIFDWTYGRLWQLWSLRSRRRHTEKAQQLADRIREYQDRHPGRPVHLIGHSGGGAMIAYTLEQLEPHQIVTSGVMLVPAISSDYDLRVPVSRTEKGIWNFCSRADVFFLGMGTLLFGTTDGKHQISAGNTGFSPQVIENARLSSIVRLRNVPYRWDMWKTGHTGGHLSVTRAGFIARDIAPLLIE